MIPPRRRVGPIPGWVFLWSFEGFRQARGIWERKKLGCLWYRVTVPSSAGAPQRALWRGWGGVGGAEVQVRWRYRSSRLPCPEPCLLSGPWILPLISSLLGYPPPQNPSSLCLAWRPFRENIDSHGGSIRAEGTPRGSAFKQTPGLKECLPLRPGGLEPRQRAEVAPVDGTPVPAAPRGQGLPGAGGQGAVCHVGGAVPPAFAPWWGRAARPSGHLEIRSVEHPPAPPPGSKPGPSGEKLGQDACPRVTGEAAPYAHLGSVLNPGPTDRCLPGSWVSPPAPTLCLP